MVLIKIIDQDGFQTISVYKNEIVPKVGDFIYFNEKYGKKRKDVYEVAEIRFVLTDGTRSLEEIEKKETVNYLNQINIIVNKH
jgi:hypothetical protein